MAKSGQNYRGQLMLQIASGKYFRPGIDLHKTPQRQVLYSNLAFAAYGPFDFTLGRLSGSTVNRDVPWLMLEVVDRLEAQDWDGSDSGIVATGGSDLLDDVAYVMTFVLNRTFFHDHDVVRRLTGPRDPRISRRNGSRYIPDLFDPDAVLPQAAWGRFAAFLDTLIGLGRDDFARVTRAIRRSVDATRRAVDDPTGAYVDMVAALESLSESARSSPTTWDRYDNRKRKILDPVLEPLDTVDRERVQAAILEADQAGLKRRFVSSTLARVAPSFYREDATGMAAPPRGPDLEQMLGLAYDIRSRRSHVLEDLGDEAWLFTDGSETINVPRYETMLTIAGLWRLVRHVVTEFVNAAPQVRPEPWDYNGALPGIVQVPWAPQYWVSGSGVDADTATYRFGATVEAYIDIVTKRTTDGINLTEVVKEIETLVPTLPDSEARTALVAIHVLWHSWIEPDSIDDGAKAFMAEYEHVLQVPSMSTYVAAVLSAWNHGWTVDQWRDLARARREHRQKHRTTDFPDRFDAILQLETADYLEETGRHDEAVIHARWAVEECPGHQGILEWERKLVAGDHDPEFAAQPFLYRTEGEDVTADSTSGKNIEQSPVDGSETVD